MKTLVKSNSQTTVPKLSEELKVSIWKISIHLKAIKKVKKLNKWVPHLLNKKRKEKRYEICSMLNNRNESNPFLSRIITCDEKWILYDNLKRPAEQIDRGSSPRYFQKPSLHQKNVMITVWRSNAGFIYYEFIPADDK